MVRRPDIERRIFIRDFGRGVLGISIGGVLLVACGDGEAAATTLSSATTTSTPTTQVSTTSTTAGSTTTTVQSTTTTAAPATTAAPRSVLSVERVALGSTTAYLMVRGTEVAIVDTGTGGRTGDIGAALATVGLGWTDVGTVIITHKHGDHVGSLNGVLRKATEAIVGTGQADIAGINSERPLEAFEDGQVVFGSTIIATPGHTAGHISVWDEPTRVLIAGDALNGGGSGVAGVDGVSGPNAQYTPDMTTAIESARKIAALEPDTIFFGHGTPKRGDAAAALTALLAEL